MDWFHIKKLAPDVVQKLAAGEYILRPANAVKEMIENSLDAKATSIVITVRNGGVKFLQVVDNGTGISKEDLNILCERHTTSKLENFEQLGSVGTYGFRGEAMSSISALAHVSLKTKTPDARCGYEVSYREGVMKGEPVACAANNGTVITVENMFYNTPLRLKALKNIAEEFRRIKDVITAYAVHNYSVMFILKKLGEGDISVKTSTNSTLLKTIENLYGSDVSRNLLETGGQNELLQFKYQVAVTNLKYSSPKMVFLLFVNHRFVKSEGLKKEINDLYKIYLPQNRKPFIYISLKMNPQVLDVNVHPSKEKVFYLHEDSINKKIVNVIEHLITGKEAYQAYQMEIEPKPIKQITKVKQSTLRLEAGCKSIQNSKVDNADKEDTELCSWNVSSLGVLKSNILRNCDRELQRIIRNSTFIKCVDYGHIMIQHADSIYICDLKYYCEDFFYQLSLDGITRYQVLIFSEPASLKELLKEALTRKNKDVNVELLIRRLIEAAPMLNDYFSIRFDNKYNLISLPLLWDGYLPSVFDLPTFIMNLASNVVWDTEEACIDGVSREIALYYSTLPSVNNPFISSQEWFSFVENNLYPSFKEQLYPTAKLHEKHTVNILDISSVEIC